MRATRKAPAEFVLGLALATATGCAVTETACPAIGYFSTLKVVIEGGTAHDVLVCDGDVCAPSEKASAEGYVITGAGNGEVWTFTGQFPQDFTLRVMDGDGTILTDAAVTPDWVRTGGSEACGGPAEATVTVRI